MESVAGSRAGALAIAIALVASTVAVSGVLIIDIESGPEPELRPRGGSSPVRSDDTLRIAGSGSNVPLTRRLVEAYRRAHPGAAIVVHDSIGSTGGIRAVADGVIDLGLASRPLRGAETSGIVATAYARVPVVVAAHAEVPDGDIPALQLVAIYRGARTRWSDGSSVWAIQRERGDSSHEAIARGLPGFEEANQAAWRARRFAVAYSDRDMEAALMGTRGAVGVADLGAITVQRLPLRILSIDGVQPSADAVMRGTYPYSKDLSFVRRLEPGAAAGAFLYFVASPAGRAIIREAGYVALPMERP